MAWPKQSEARDGVLLLVGNPLANVVAKAIRLLGIKAGAVNDESTDDIRVNVRGRASVLNVALLVSSGGGRDSYRGSSVTSSVREALHGGGLVVASQTLLVVLTVELEVLLVLSTKFLNESVDVLHASLTSSHLGSRVVGMATSSVPVLEELRLEGEIDSEVFTNTTKEIARHPKVVSDLNAKARSDLVFPLTWHDFTISA